MIKMRLTIILTIVLYMGACQLFLGPDPDNSPRGIFEHVWTDFNETYALFEHKGIDWNAVYKQFTPRISSNMDDRELFNVLAEMLKVLDDAHVILSSSFAFSNSAGWLESANIDPFSLDVIKTYLTNGGTTTADGMFTYGTFSSNPEIGYIYIAGFVHNEGIAATAHQNWIRAIDGIVQSLSNTNSLILDNRSNWGGLPANVNFIASRFASTHKNYADIRTKNGPGRNDFSAPVYEEIRPDGTRYTKPIVLLTNSQTISGAEWFTLALRSQDHITHIGETTVGALSLSLDRPLINGWRYTVSVQIVRDMNGICYEGTGIAPEHIVVNTPDEIAAGKDSQLEFALGFLTK